MTLSSRFASSGAVCLAMSMSASVAEAREVVYRAPAECPEKDEVAARLEARAPGRPARIDVTKTSTGFHGDLVVGDGDRSIARSVDAQTCGAVVEALALVVALNREEEPQPASAEPAPRSGVTASTIDAPVADADVGRPLPPPPRKTRWSFGNSFTFAGVGAGAVFQGFGLFVDAAGAKPLADLAILEPSARLGLGFTFPDSVGNDPLVRDKNGVYCPGCGPVMSLVKQAIDLCPVGAGHHGTVSFSICARTELGVLVADNAGTSADPKARLWAAMGPVGRGRVLLNNGVARAFFEIEGGAMGILRRDRFHFEGYDTFVARPWAWVFASNVGVVLP